MFTVARERMAVERKAEMVLNQKRRDYRIEPWVRTAELPDQAYRLGDVRLECEVMMAIGKEEMSLMMSVTMTALMRTTHWCGYFTDADKRYSVSTHTPITRATLHEGERRLDLPLNAQGFEVEIADASWSDEARIDVEFRQTNVDAEEKR